MDDFFNNPFFFVVGVQKAGTSTLYNWLNQHPEICLPMIKETHFFSHKERFNNGIEWYKKQFIKKKQASIWGEVDPEYIFSPDAARRIIAYVNNPKLIVVLRNPLDRAFSHYLMSVRRGYEDMSFRDAVRAEKYRIANDGLFASDNYTYISRSLYAQQLQTLNKKFQCSDIMYIKFDDLIDKSKQSDLIRNILIFIGVESDIKLNLNKAANVASNPRSMWLRDLIYGHAKLKTWAGKLLPKGDWRLRLAMFIDLLNQKTVSKVDQEVHIETKNDIDTEIISEMYDDLIEVEKITGLDLTSWKRSKF